MRHERTMRLLMFILTLAWLVFGWFCYNAIHWKKPMEVPWHVADQLQIYTPELIEAKIANSLITLSRGTNLPAIEKAHYHFELAQGFWLKAFIQKSRVHQITFLNRSLYEIQAALRLYPQESDYLKEIANVSYQTADVYHVLKDYEKAEEHYLKALKIKPVHPMALRRYKEMLEESGFEDRSNL